MFYKANFARKCALNHILRCPNSHQGGHLSIPFVVCYYYLPGFVKLGVVSYWYMGAQLLNYPL